MAYNKITINQIICWGISLVSVLNTTAQGIAIDNWRDHLPYKETVSLAESPNRIFCATPYDIFIYHKSDETLERLSKINGLSDIGINIIKYHEPSNTLLIAYSNGNIDFIQNDLVYNMGDIKRSNIISDKGIYNIMFYNDLAYLSCGFGIVVVDMDNYEIKDTYLIGPQGNYLKVNDIATDQNNLYAATNAGIYVASMSGSNLADYNNWQKQSAITVPDGIYNLAEFFNGKIYVNYQNPSNGSDSIYYYNNGSWQLMTNFQNDSHKDFQVYQDKIVISKSWKVEVYDNEWNVTNSLWTYGTLSPKPASAILGAGDTLWVADKRQGLVKNWNIWNNSFYIPNGPASINSHFITADGGNVVVAPGGISGSFGNIWNQDGFSRFDGTQWNVISKDNTPELDTIFDIVALAIDPQDNKRVYCGTLGNGILEFYDDKYVTEYSETNSSLHSLESFHWIGVTKLLFDNNNNLWATNTGITNCVTVKDANNSWYSYDFSSYLSASKKRIRDLVIDNIGQKWVVLAAGEGLLVFNDNNTLTNTNDDQAIVLNTIAGNGNLPSAEIYSIAVDNDGEIWVGTDKGIAVFYSPGNVFSGDNFDAEQILVQQDGYTQLLMETEIVTCIAVDGANRKWMGTQNSGVFLMSADGTEEIYHFTTDNSPLFSDAITSIAIDQISGEVFIGTVNGLLSFRGSATEGAEDFNHVVVFPNPVYHGYEGPIAIKGLVANSSVKITNENGVLVYQTTAEGGQAIWDGKNFTGQKAKTGVYLVFVSNSNGSKTNVAKILLIN